MEINLRVEFNTFLAEEWQELHGTIDSLEEVIELYEWFDSNDVRRLACKHWNKVEVATKSFTDELNAALEKRIYVDEDNERVVGILIKNKMLSPELEITSFGKKALEFWEKPGYEYYSKFKNRRNG